MLSEEEKKAIEIFNDLINYLEKWNKNLTLIPEDKKYYKIVLNLITKLQKENEEKDKQIKNLQSRKDNQEKRFKKYKENIDKQHEEIYENLVSEQEKYKYLYQKALDNTVSEDKENIQLKKQIDLMAEYIDEEDVTEIFCDGKTICDENCTSCVKQYFETKAKGE